ncbi:MAG TPA: hypothetical protein VGJ01_06335 [Pseudolabrys sp.]|jgi:hypothetical protein
MDDSNDAWEHHLFSKPSPALLIAYLSYAVPDVSALSARSTSFLESAIEALRDVAAQSAGASEASH